MFGKGILKGLAVTAKEAAKPRLTEKYPEEKPALPSRWRGATFVLDKEACISCGLCAMACPNKVIRQKFAKDEDNKKICTEFVFDRQYCLFCGLCIEACPKNCLHMTQEFETAVYLPGDIPQDVLAGNDEHAPLSTYGVKPAPARPAASAAKPAALKAAAPAATPKPAAPAAEVKAEEPKPAAPAEGGGE